MDSRSTYFFVIIIYVRQPIYVLYVKNITTITTITPL